VVTLARQWKPLEGFERRSGINLRRLLMSELIPYSTSSTEVAPTGVGALVERKADRLARKQVEQLQRTKRVGLARLEVQAQLESARAQAVGYVGQQAMQTVTMVSQLEGQLGAACPLAVSRLQGIADMTALSLAEVVSDAARKMGR
jgi:hypothetical protein